MSEKPKLLITGAAGTIGQLLLKHLKDRYGLVLCDQKPPLETAGFPFIPVDIADFTSLAKVFEQAPGIHTVIHLAADPRTFAPWESLLPNNIVGVYNLFESAHQAGCQRVIFASSINAVQGYPLDLQINTGMPVAPLNLYGASKAWGEAVGRFYADAKALAVYCLRLGWVTAPDAEVIKTVPDELLRMTLSHRDLLKLFDACLTSELKFGIFHGISDNFFKRLDLSDSKAKLAYEPSDDGYALAGKLDKGVF